MSERTPPCITNGVGLRHGRIWQSQSSPSHIPFDAAVQAQRTLVSDHVRPVRLDGSVSTDPVNAESPGLHPGFPTIDAFWARYGLRRL